MAEDLLVVIFSASEVPLVHVRLCSSWPQGWGQSLLIAVGPAALVFCSVSPHCAKNGVLAIREDGLTRWEMAEARGSGSQVPPPGAGREATPLDRVSRRYALVGVLLSAALAVGRVYLYPESARIVLAASAGLATVALLFLLPLDALGLGFMALLAILGALPGRARAVEGFSSGHGGATGLLQGGV